MIKEKKLNNEQSELKLKITEFINSKENGFFGILGAGGTGKTFTICKSLDAESVLWLGATNKAVSEIKKNLTEDGYLKIKAKTIDSFFGFKIKKDHFNKTIITHRQPNLKDIPKIIVIDEISLINNRSFDLLKELKHKRKFILIGDNMQIPPIEDEFIRDKNGFKVSKIFTELDYSFTLTIQNRQNVNSKLYDFINKFRENMNRKIPLIPIVEKYANSNDILYYQTNDKELKELIKGENPIAVCYKNMTALSFNWLIGSTKSNKKGYKVNELNIGDNVYSNSFYKYNQDVFYTGEKFSIVDIESFNKETLDVGDIKPCEINYKIITCKKESGLLVDIRVSNGYNETLHPVSYRINRVIEKINKQINLSNNTDQKWVLRKKIAVLNTLYSDLKISFADLKKPFAISCHKAQGSTYKDVIIPIYDFANVHSQDANQLLYVAISRAKERIIFVNRPTVIKDDSNRYGFSEMERDAIASSQSYKCNVCEIDFNDGREYDIDHIIPLANGGKNTLTNLQAICKNCHKEKTSKEKYNEQIF